MLGNALAIATIPAENLERARRFYSEVLGLKFVEQDSREGALVFEAGNGSRILMYERARTTAEHTAITFVIDDVEAVVQQLNAKGVTMEQYDMPGIKTDARGIAESDGMKMAWLKDPEGNILGVVNE